MAFGTSQRRAGFGQSKAPRLLEYAVAAAFLVAVAVLAAALAAVSSDTLSGKAMVVDGDSLQFGDQRVRLEGIDAPEFSQICIVGGKNTECGKLARSHLRSLVSGRAVNCAGWQVDKYDRPLVRCTVGGLDLNAAMVRDGWAVAFGDFELEEAEARNKVRGLWQGVFDEPSDWRRDHSGDARESLPHRGEISALFAKISQRIVGWMKFW